MELDIGEAQRRGIGARVGIAALNLIAPGLGLLRVADLRGALLWLLAPFALIASATIMIGLVPITGFAHALVALVVVLALLATLYLVPIVLTWRGSRIKRPLPFWSRWYGLVAAVAVVFGLTQAARSAMHHFYKPFYAPSESMAPTIETNDKFFVDMRWRGPLTRGDIIVFSGPDGARVSRIAALPEDTVAMIDGRPVINGVRVAQSDAGAIEILGFDGRHAARSLFERLPNEAASHRVLDDGASMFDETAPVTVPAGHFFVLGDNRDRSADSRVPRALGGVGMVPGSAILGRPIYIHWSSDRAKIGTRLDR